MFVITYRKLLLTIAAVVMVGSAIIISALGLNLGLDFTGGSLTEVSYEAAPSKETVEETVGGFGFAEYSVRASVDESGKDTYFIRTQDLTDEQRGELVEAVTQIGEGGEVTRFTSIGPVIGEELRGKAGWAIFGVVSIIVLYVAFAFAGIGTPVSSWMYGAITIFVLIHDVLVPTALMSILGYTFGVEVDVLFVMALLAVLGYSVNDTIVVFDRVRENLTKNRTEHRKKHTEPGGLVREEVTYTLTKPYDEIVGSAVSETMARSINTSVTTLVVLLGLYFFGGSVTQTFALVLLAGVLAGTYSSICIASPLVVTYAMYKAAKKTK
ncbi:MAG: protein translocase subunit SecF [Candidatus Kaiserbacteria bacterium]|nr:protein translocase subunit SecF [Candidatus Kaiserbacteria bacterium]MCB9816336.1 protein translocase subunit SecF [Candidatus Nomurabacteria bacterium]